MNNRICHILTTYFGLKVEVVIRMEHLALIRFRGRDFIVETADLVLSRSFNGAV